jgi:HPt (histidine-containing phosphotransfer) domain-containing protein
VFDSALIEQYRSVLGERGAAQMVDLFVQTLTERTVELQVAVDSGDIGEINRVGHAVKGMAAAIGAVSLSECGLDLQNATADAVPQAHARFVHEAAVAAAGVRDAWMLPAI